MFLVSSSTEAGGGSSLVAQLPTNAGDARDEGPVPRSGRSPGGRHGKPLQCSCLENPTDRGAQQAIVLGVTELDTTEHIHTQWRGRWEKERWKVQGIRDLRPDSKQASWQAVFKQWPGSYDEASHSHWETGTEDSDFPHLFYLTHQSSLKDLVWGEKNALPTLNLKSIYLIF